jgi:hypothetical protein
MEVARNVIMAMKEKARAVRQAPHPEFAMPEKTGARHQPPQ